MNNSDDFFLKQMKGVSPIKKNNRIKKDGVLLPIKIIIHFDGRVFKLEEN